MRNSLIFLVLISTLTFFTCQKEAASLSEVPVFSKLDFSYTEEDQVFNRDLVKLGRVLFYDKNLSLNSEVSCGSCHKQEFGFGDDVAKSIGFLQGPSINNTPNLIDIKDKEVFFWQGTSSSLPDAVTRPIVNEDEMGMTPAKVVSRLSNLEYYDEFFMDAFGDNGVTRTRISIALSQFVGSIISTNARIDQIREYRDELSDLEREGMTIFRDHCNSCHEVFPIDERTENPVPYYGKASNRVDIGLPFDADGDVFSFLGEKHIVIPSLKNLPSTAPYMHDGRFATLKEVIEHYNEGVVDRRTVDMRLLDDMGAPKRLELTEGEIDGLIVFLQTMWDSTIEEEEKFSDPFIR